MWIRRLWYVILLLTTLSLVTACSDNATYTTFSRWWVKQLDFTFEYPRDWWVSPVEKYSDLVKVNIVGTETSENESGIVVLVSVWLGLGSQAEQEAQDRLSDDISVFKMFPNFELVRQGSITLDGCRGYEVECTYDFVPRSLEPPQITRPTHVLNITIPRHGMVYEIWISASQNEWNAREKDIRHILDTFRWRAFPFW